MSKILVTGGAGFIGSTLVDKLVSEGHEVAVIDDLSSGRLDYVNPSAKFYQLDIASPAVADVFKSEHFDVVYHLAAQMEVSKSMVDPRHDNAVNLGGGFNILENARQNGVKKIIFASTGGAIYGDPKEIPTPETYPTYPLSFYGIHKLAFEKYLNCYRKVYGQDYTVLRFANVYGPRQFKGGEAGVIAIFVENAVRGKESIQNGDGTQTRDFVYVDDVANALSRAKEVFYQGEINIASGIETNLLDVRQAISKAIGAEMPVKVGPAKPGEEKRSCLSPKLAKQILDWEPEVMLEEGIKRTIDWAKSLEKK